MDNNSPASSTPSHPRDDGLLPLFDATTDLPAKEPLPSLLENFYEYYADTYFFLLNRKQLESLIEQGEASAFLVCVISAIFTYCHPQKQMGPAGKSGSLHRRPWREVKRSPCLH